MEDNPPDDRRSPAYEHFTHSFAFFASCGAAVCQQNRHRIRAKIYLQQFGKRVGLLAGALLEAGIKSGMVSLTSASTHTG